jgi:DNA-binding IclR family transcriptional regulator
LDTAAASAPLRNHTGDIVAAITISRPEERFTRALQQACVERVTSAAKTLSHAPGYKEAQPE